MSEVIITTRNELESLIQTTIRQALSEQVTPPTLAPDQDKLLTLKEAAAFLNLAPQTLYGFTSKRLMPFIKRGKKLYFSKEALSSWLLEGKRKSIAEIKAELTERG